MASGNFVAWNNSRITICTLRSIFYVCKDERTQTWQAGSNFANELYFVAFFLREPVKLLNCSPSIAHSSENKKTFCKNKWWFSIHFDFFFVPFPILFTFIIESQNKEQKNCLRPVWKHLSWHLRMQQQWLFTFQHTLLNGPVLMIKINLYACETPSRGVFQMAEISYIRR